MGNENQKPLVSICCITYNHEPYIRECLEGFLMQKTNFPFEVLIHDDASTDGTADIIREYEAKYPDIIKPIYQTENQYSKPNHKPITLWNYERAQGKYIAMCEGDDFWTDPSKLQIQVDYMESHPECSLCFHPVNVYKQELKKYINSFPKIEERDYSGQEVFETWTVPTCSILFKTEFYNDIPHSKDFWCGDIIVILTMSRHGQLHAIARTMGTYRRTNTGACSTIWHDYNENTYQRFIRHDKAILNEFNFINEKTIFFIKISRLFKLLQSIKKQNGFKCAFQRFMEEKFVIQYFLVKRYVFFKLIDIYHFMKKKINF